MAKILYSDFTLPDMRSYKTKATIPVLAKEIYKLNKERVDTAIARQQKSAFGSALISPIEAIEASLIDKAGRNPDATLKEIAIKAMNSRLFSTREEVYARNTITMLKNSRSYDELRKLVGWNKGIQTEKFSYNKDIGYMVYDGKWVIKHEEDYFVADGLEIIGYDDYLASIDLFE